MNKNWNAKLLAEGAIMIALAVLLGSIRLFKMPQGGSVTIGEMIPLILFALRHGSIKGMIVGGLYGALSALLSGYVVHPVQFLLDYPLGFAALGLAGIFSKDFYNNQNIASVLLGSFIGVLFRLIAHVLSGVVFFAEYAGTQNPWIYSFIYNGSFLGVELLITVIILFVLSNVILKNFIKKELV